MIWWGDAASPPLRHLPRRAYRMAMPKVDRIWTRAEVHALPDDGNRYELIDGHLLVSPSPRLAHQLALLALARLVADYVDRHGLGAVGCSPADFDLGLGDVSQPDLFVIPPPPALTPHDWAGVGLPILVAEVISPSTARHDRTIKRRRYQEAGIPTYWIVDLDAGVVEVWHPSATSPLVADQTLVWRPKEAIPPLEIDLVSYFRPEWRGS